MTTLNKNMNKIEINNKSIEIPAELLFENKICGVYFESDEIRNQFGKKILLELKKSEHKKKSILISDLKIGFNEDATVIENILIQRLILGLEIESSILIKVCEKTNLLSEIDILLKDISEVKKLMLGFNNQTTDLVHTLILNEWPVVVFKKINIDTSHNLTQYLSEAKRKIILSTDEDLIKSISTVIFKMQNWKLINYDY